MSGRVNDKLNGGGLEGYAAAVRKLVEDAGAKPEGVDAGEAGKAGLTVAQINELIAQNQEGMPPGEVAKGGFVIADGYGDEISKLLQGQDVGMKSRFTNISHEPDENQFPKNPGWVNSPMVDALRDGRLLDLIYPPYGESFWTDVESINPGLSYTNEVHFALDEGLKRRFSLRVTDGATTSAAGELVTKFEELQPIFSAEPTDAEVAAQAERFQQLQAKLEPTIADLQERMRRFFDKRQATIDEQDWWIRNETGSIEPGFESRMRILEALHNNPKKTDDLNALRNFYKEAKGNAVFTDESLKGDD